jgi:hypothetical protein
MLNLTQALQIIGMSLGILVAGLIAKLITADKTPSRYYLDREARGGYTCVVGDSDYWWDGKVFCSEDVDKALRVMRELNQQAR